MVNSKNHMGFDIILAIDESSSMRESMETVKRMCATLYDSISDLPRVRLTVIGWNGTGSECFIKKITKKKQPHGRIKLIIRPQSLTFSTLPNLDFIKTTNIDPANPSWYCFFFTEVTYLN